MFGRNVDCIVRIWSIVLNDTIHVYVIYIVQGNFTITVEKRVELSNSLRLNLSNNRLRKIFILTSLLKIKNKKCNASTYASQLTICC
jgi:hypothetical protein